MERWTHSINKRVSGEGKTKSTYRMEATITRTLKNKGKKAVV